MSTVLPWFRNNHQLQHYNKTLEKSINNGLFMLNQPDPFHSCRLLFIFKILEINDGIFRFDANSSNKIGCILVFFDFLLDLLALI